MENALQDLETTLSLQAFVSCEALNKCDAIVVDILVTLMNYHDYSFRWPLKVRQCCLFIYLFIYVGSL